MCVVTHPRIDEFERLYLTLYATGLTFDPNGTGIRVRIGAGDFPMIWVGLPVAASDGTWSQYARTVAMFTGSGVVPVAGDAALLPGRYLGTPIIILVDGQVVALPATPIDVL